MWDMQRLIPVCACAQSDQNLSRSLEYSMTVQLLTKQYLEFQSLKGGCTGSSESTLVKNAIVGNLISWLKCEKRRYLLPTVYLVRNETMLD